ncbi:MAG: ribonuclease H-like domain-containing protein [Candidatus Pacebacteria bacterium]|nr:ribonuclease H-like domain-containing protein [Candidatus Paceibacterota bacterium]
MRKIVFDIETQNTFQEVGSSDVTSLDISVVCVHDSETNSYSSYTIDEIDKLWSIIEKADMLIGYNSDHFDIPLLNKYYQGDLTHIQSLDILAKIKEVAGKRVRLDQIAEATIGENKSGHGLQAVTWWKQGKIDKIVKYCLDDVRITKDIYDFAMKEGYLKYSIAGDEQIIKLDTSQWEKPNESEKSTMTQSLF